MAGQVKTEAIVLRKLRYGEADSILQLQTEQLGRVGAIAKGVRRSGSRFGGRLEPFFRLELVLHQGRGELMTITSAETLNPHSALRTRAEALSAASEIAGFVLKLLDDREKNLAAYNLTANALALLDADAAAARPEVVLAYRAKLLVTTGFSPELSACVNCGATEGLTAFSPASGGVVCADCRSSGDFAFEQAAHEFFSGLLASPMAEAATAQGSALRQVDRAISETLAHHAQVRVRNVV